MKNAKKKQETVATAAMRGTGLTCRQIGGSYGIAPSTVDQRFRKKSLIPAQSESKAAQINVERLVRLYASEKLSLARIAEAFNVPDSAVKKALTVHRIPKRRQPSHGGKYFDRLRKLEIGESLEIACPAAYPREVLMSSARRLGIKIFIKSVAAGLFRVTRINPAESRMTFQLAQIDRARLEELYAAGKLTINEIAGEMNISVRKIRRALKAFGTPKRPRNRGYGKYTSVLGVMAIGDAADLECATKRPHINLHTIANRLGIKISLRKIANGVFRVERVG